MKYKNALFTKYLLTYMAVSIVTVSVFGAFLYWNNIRSIHETTFREYQSAVTGNRVTVDKQLAQIYDISIILQSRKSTDTLRQLKRPINPTDILQLIHYSDELKPYCYTSSFLSNLIVYFKNSDMMVSTDGSGIYPEVFYNVMLNYPGMTYHEWQKKMNGPQIMQFYRRPSEKEEDSYIDIYQEFPFQPSSSQIIMIARIGEKQLTSGLEQLTGSGAIAIVTQENGTPIVTSENIKIDTGLLKDANSGEEVTINHQSYIVFMEHSESIDWKYFLLIPKSWAFAQEKQMVFTILTLVTAILLAGLIMSVVFSTSNIKPLKRLVSFVSMRSDYKKLANTNEYGNLEYNIQNLITNNYQLKDIIERRIKSEREHFIERLIKGSFSSTEDLKAMALHSGISIDYAAFVPVLFEVLGYNSEYNPEFLQEIDIAAAMAAKFLEDQTEGTALVYKEDLNRIALVLCLKNKGGRILVEEILTELIDRTAQQTGLKLRCLAGEPSEAPGYIGSSYSALIQASQNPDPENEKKVHFVERSVSKSYFYPLDTEGRLLNYLRSGNVREAKETLDYLFSHNLGTAHVSAPAFDYFINSMTGTFIRARNMTELDDTEQEKQFDKLIYLAKNKDMKNQKEQFFAITDMLCQSVKEKSALKNERLADAIALFIQQNYADDRLGLSMIASNFNLTDNYLSFFYKKQTGENLSAVIENFRMERSLELLAQNKKSIKEIAAAVGYQNLNTFYKAFKRSYGVSPTVYSEKHPELRYSSTSDDERKE